MRLVSLHLWNIRSYTDATVTFGDGVNLFEGDIGSGKSTILLAVEFALFGLAEVASASLLRHGEKEGGVELVFAVKDRTYKATRKLGRTGSGASVKGCALEVDGKETKLSSNEMRQRVLGLLEYGERRNPRARLDIFTYSVYTPQEEMRTVLTNDIKMRNQRKDTLRRALDLEEYELAATNLDRVRVGLNNDAAELRGKASKIGSVRKDLAEIQGKLGHERDRLAKAVKDLGTATAKVEAAADRYARLKKGEARYREAALAATEAEKDMAQEEGKVGRLSAEVDAVRAKVGELDKVRSRLAEGADQLEELADLEREEARLEALRVELEAATGDLERLRAGLERSEQDQERAVALEEELKGLSDPTEGIEKARKGLEDLRSKGISLEHEVRGLDEEMGAIDAEDEELTSLEGEASCPRCRQPLTKEHVDDLLATNQTRRREISSRMREVASQRNRVLEELEDKEGSLKELEGRSEERRRLAQDLERARSGASGIEDLRKSIEGHPATSLEKELKAMRGSWDATRLADLRKVAGAIQELKGVEGTLEKTLEGLPEMERRLGDARSALDEAVGSAKRAQEELEEASVGWDGQEVALAHDEHEEAVKVESYLRASMGEMEKMVEMLEGSTDKLIVEVAKLEEVMALEVLYVHVSDWIKDRLIPAIRSMERSVMSLMADEMDEAASRWFGQLVEDPDLVLAIDEDFVPTVAHQDYEMDLGALSGGERTAAAFAYRLALNGLVRRNAIPDQRNLLILDEPTDGFSREQLARLGNVFTDLAADQVVVVSHDRELRTFADRVYMVRKVGGSSHVQQVA
jgi:exonuclease SbcC